MNVICISPWFKHPPLSRLWTPNLEALACAALENMKCDQAFDLFITEPVH